MAREGNSLNVTLDILLEAFDPKAEGSDANAYRVKAQLPGGNTSIFYVVKEIGQYRLLDSEDKPNAVALEMLDRIRAWNSQAQRCCWTGCARTTLRK